jgi:hypothetical protein
MFQAPEREAKKYADDPDQETNAASTSLPVMSRPELQAD